MGAKFDSDKKMWFVTNNNKNKNILMSTFGLKI